MGMASFAAIGGYENKSCTKVNCAPVDLGNAFGCGAIFLRFEARQGVHPAGGLNPGQSVSYFTQAGIPLLVPYNQ
jgi:hypothetical protein